MNSKEAGEILLKAQTVTTLYFDTKDKSYGYGKFKKQLQDMGEFTEDEISIIWDIFFEIDATRLYT